MGARYELVNANMMLVNLDINLNVSFLRMQKLRVKRHSIMQANSNLISTKGIFNKQVKYMNPVKMIKMYDPDN